MAQMLSTLWRELRKLRYLRSGFRNYWYGEDMPYLRNVTVRLRRLFNPGRLSRPSDCPECYKETQ